MRKATRQQNQKQHRHSTAQVYEVADVPLWPPFSGREESEVPEFTSEIRPSGLRSPPRLVDLVFGLQPVWLTVPLCEARLSRSLASPSKPAVKQEAAWSTKESRWKTYVAPRDNIHFLPKQVASVCISEYMYIYIYIYIHIYFDQRPQ